MLWMGKDYSQKYKVKTFAAVHFLLHFIQMNYESEPSDRYSSWDVVRSLIDEQASGQPASEHAQWQ